MRKLSACLLGMLASLALVPAQAEVSAGDYSLPSSSRMPIELSADFKEDSAEALRAEPNVSSVVEEAPVQHCLPSPIAVTSGVGAFATSAVQFGASQSEAVQNGASQTEAVQSGASQTEAVQSNANQSEAVQTGASQTEAVQSGASQSEAVQSNANQSKALQSGVAKSSSVKSKASKSGAVKSKQAQSKQLKARGGKQLAQNSAAKAKAPAADQGKKIKVTAYAYCINGRTASGTRTGYGTIAVDPSLIPLGSKVYIPGYGWGKALDTGGSMRGRVIDIWYPSTSECLRWGVRQVTITVLPK